MSVSYLTVEHQATAEMTERRSRFIGTLLPVATEEQALAAVAALKKRYWDARHNAWAFVLREGGISRCSDDGEPQGTAGVPVLDVLRKRGLTDCLMVVTRYFGGILLGTGGLVRAYSQTASLTISAANVAERRLCVEGMLSCSYAQYGGIQAILSEEKGVVDDVQFADTICLQFHLPEEYAAGFSRKLTEFSGGTLFFYEKSKNYYSFFKKNSKSKEN